MFVSFAVGTVALFVMTVITLAAFFLALGVLSSTLLGGSRVLLGAMLIMAVRFQIAVVMPWSKPESTFPAPCFPPGFAAFAK